MFVVAICVHELGHLVAARWCGVRVVTFSVGLGPELIGFTDRFGTRWMLRAIPLGGSVAMQDAPRCTELIVPSREPNQLDGLSDKSIKQRAAIYLSAPAFILLLAVGILG